MSIIAITNRNIAAEKIEAISYINGELCIATGSPGPFVWIDPDGTLYDSAMKQWREYLSHRECRFMDAVQYGVILAAERGRI